jgi:enoyl-CoA hydratase
MGTSTPPLLVERSAAVLRVTLDRPTRANALDAVSIDRFHAVLDDMASTRDLRALVVTSTGDNFCGGFDLGRIEDQDEATIVVRFLRIELLLQRLYHAPFVTIACAQGNAVGAGADLFAACTYRILEPATRLRMPGWRFGVALGTKRLCDRIGVAAAERYLAAGNSWRGADALAAGLATHMAAKDDWEPLIAEAIAASQHVDDEALGRLHGLCVPDHRDADMAALVTSVLSVPGLKSRLLNYVRAQRRT